MRVSRVICSSSSTVYTRSRHDLFGLPSLPHEDSMAASQGRESYSTPQLHRRSLSTRSTRTQAHGGREGGHAPPAARAPYMYRTRAFHVLPACLLPSPPLMHHRSDRVPCTCERLRLPRPTPSSRQGAGCQQRPGPACARVRRAGLPGPARYGHRLPRRPVLLLGVPPERQRPLRRRQARGRPGAGLPGEAGNAGGGLAGLRDRVASLTCILAHVCARVLRARMRACLRASE